MTNKIIPRDASFFMKGFGDEPVLPPGKPCPFGNPTCVHAPVTMIGGFSSISRGQDEAPALPPLPRYDRAVRLSGEVVSVEVTDLPSNGIPTPIGEDEPTIPYAAMPSGVRL